MTMNCGRWKSIPERCQGISDGQSRMTAAILNFQRDRGFQKGARMERLTTNKNVSDMGMVELALNCCYIAKDGSGRYRDYEIDMDERDFVRKLTTTLVGEDLPLQDESFDEEMMDNLGIDPFADVRGLIAIFYRNMWSMAELREKLKRYEDAEEQGIYGKWIPVSERLPEEPKENEIFDNKPLELYLVSIKGDPYPFRAFWNGKFFTNGWQKCEVTAWMPLPEPYRESEEENGK